MGYRIFSGNTGPNVHKSIETNPMNGRRREDYEYQWAHCEIYFPIIQVDRPVSPLHYGQTEQMNLVHKSAVYEGEDRFINTALMSYTGIFIPKIHLVAVLDKREWTSRKLGI